MSFIKPMNDPIAASGAGPVQASGSRGGEFSPSTKGPAPKENLSSSRRVIQLDFIRGVAILGVMEFHFLSVPVNNVFARYFEYVTKRVGWMGVDLFFVLSGFLVGGLLVQELVETGTIQIGRFLARRTFKIWPAYYVYILFQIAARKHPLSTFAWQNLLNVQNYAGTSLNHTWSLAVEEHFYIFLPLLLLLIHRKSGWQSNVLPLLGGIGLIVLCGRIIAVYWFRSDPELLTHARIDSLLFGVILSYTLYARRSAFDHILRSRIPLLLASITGLLFAFAVGEENREMWSFGFTLNYLALGSLMLLIYGYHGRLTGSYLYKIVAKIGIYSYGIYLWHLSVRVPLAKLADHLPSGIRWGGLLVGQYAAAIILGVIMTKAVEFPMLRLRERLVPRGPAQLPPEMA